MRHNSSNRRSRGRNNRGKNGGNNRSQVFDSNGPEVRIRGTAHQICEKYEALAKDARSAGDAVLAESYLQHAEHYQRMIVAWNEQSRDREEQHAESEEKPERKVIRAENDDLGLPGSILGEAVEVEDIKKSLENA